MFVSHTKFSPDWCFGFLKQRYRHTSVSSLEDIATVVTQSADVVKLVGTKNGAVQVPVYNWVQFFSGWFQKVPQIKHFCILLSTPGTFSMKEFSNSELKTWSLMQ